MFSARYIGKSCSNIFVKLCIFVAELKTWLTIKRGDDVVERRFSSFLNCHAVAKSFLPVELQSANPMTRFHWHWHTDIVSRYDNLRKPRFVLYARALISLNELNGASWTATRLLNAVHSRPLFRSIFKHLERVISRFSFTRCKLTRKRI